MCDFINSGGYSTTAWNAASTGITLATQARNSIAQTTANRNNNNAIGANYQSQLNQLEVQQTQINQQTAQQQSQVAREAVAERARLMTAAGESGVAGGTLDRLNNELTQHSNDAQTVLEQNRFGKIAQTASQALAMKAEADSRMRSPKTDWMGLGLQIAGTAASAYATSRTNNTLKSNKP